MNQTPQQDNLGPVDVVIMAAGKGTRMKSKLPKVLHRLGGRALLAHVAATAARIGARDVVVVTGHGAAEVEAAMAGGIARLPRCALRARSRSWAPATPCSRPRRCWRTTARWSCCRATCR
jgi:molybdopterin-guanine dinucleotide biosynthesis protein A